MRTCSLQATWIRNTILRAVRETDKDAAQHIPMNLVFAAPTIGSLSRFIYGNFSGGGSGNALHKPEDLWKYVEKYSSHLPARSEILVERPVGKDVVLITGTTGGFGCDKIGRAHV